MKTILLISNDAGLVLLWLCFIILLFIAMIIKDEIESYDSRIEKENNRKNNLLKIEKEKEKINEKISEIEKNYLNKEFIFSHNFLNLYLKKNVNTNKFKCLSLEITNNMKDLLLPIYNISFKFGLENEILFDCNIWHIEGTDVFTIEEYKELENQYGKSNIIRAFNGIFIIKSSKKEVEMALGEPDNITKKVIDNNYIEIYTYKYKTLSKINNEYTLQDDSDKNTKLIFKNGILNSIEETK